MLTSAAHQPASDGCSCPPSTVAYQLVTPSATRSRQTNGSPTLYTNTINSSSATTELRSRMADAMAASNCERAASGIRPRCTNCPTIWGITRWTLTSARINNGAAISRRTCVSTSCRNVTLPLPPQACRSAIDNSSNGTQVTRAVTSTRRRANSSASPDSRVRRQNR